MHRCQLVQVVQHNHRLSACAKLDDHTHPLAVRLVPHLRYALKPLVLRQVCDLLHQRSLVHLVRQFRHDNLHAVGTAHRLDFSLGAHDNLPAPRRIRIANAFTPHNCPACREVRTLHMLQQVFHRRIRVIDEMNDGIANLGRIVRRYVRRHAYRNAGRAVDHQVRQTRGKHHRLAQRAVEVVDVVNGVLVDIYKHLFGNRLHTRLRIAHRRRRVVVHASEVPLSVNKRQAHREVLRHSHHRLVHRVVVMRMILAQHLTHEPRALLVPLPGPHAQFLHCVEDAPLYGLQAVAHIGQRPRHDYAHRIVEVRSTHLFFDMRWLDEAIISLIGRHQNSPVFRGSASLGDSDSSNGSARFGMSELQHYDRIKSVRKQRLLK